MILTFITGSFNQLNISNVSKKRNASSVRVLKSTYIVKNESKIYPFSGSPPKHSTVSAVKHPIKELHFLEPCSRKKILNFFSLSYSVCIVELNEQ